MCWSEIISFFRDLYTEYVHGPSDHFIGKLHDHVKVAFSCDPIRNIVHLSSFGFNLEWIVVSVDRL